MIPKMSLMMVYSPQES